METIDTKLVNFFNSYLFRNVWNEPSKEYRRNIKPLMISNPVANTTVKLEYKRYELPTAEKYQVYFIPESTMNGITFREFDDWTDSVEFLNSTRVELRFHNNDGVMLPREKVFVTSHPEKPGVLIAVKREIFRKIYGDAAPYNDLYMAFYYDSDLPFDVSITTYTMNGGTDVNTVFSEAQAGTSVYVNGITTKVSQVSDISITDAIVEIVKDDNVLGEFEIDLTDTDQQRNFISTLDGHSKTIVHIPKSMNPSNKIISHNTCDVWIYPRNGAEANKNGRFLHRAIEEYTFTQVTHNDFAIPDAIINTYVDVLNTTEFKIVVQIKNHTKDNVLVTDKNYIGLLYTHDDETILDFFEGVGPEPFEFWKADVLESSEYVEMIVDTPNFVDVSNLPEYIGALGYYNSISLISQRVKTITLEELEGVVSHTLIVPVPIVFETIKVFPSVFINGSKLDQNLITVGHIASGSLAIIIDDSVVLEDGDVAKVELFEDIPHNILEVRPTATYAHIDVPNDNFVLYEVIDNPAQSAPAIGQAYSKVFLRLDDFSSVGTYVDSVGGRYVAFNPSSYGRIFIIAHNSGFEYLSYNLDSLLTSNAPLSFDLDTTIRGIDFEPPYEWEDHTSKTSSSGDVYDPLDPNAENEFPAWHLMDGDETWDLTSRWVTTLRPEGNRAIFDLDVAHQNTYWLIGYRIGALPNMNDALRASQLPINWTIKADGVVVDTVEDEWWYLNPEPIHTHILSSPVLVDSRIEFSLAGVQTNGTFTIQTDMFEPIFSDAVVETVKPYVGDIRCIPYLNGKELVQDIDFHLADFQNPGYSGTPHLAGRQLIVNNASYLKEADNKLEILICHNDVDGEIEGFLEKPYLDALNANPRWLDNLSMVATEGLVTENISTLFGTVQVPCPDVINRNLRAHFPINGDYANIGNGDYTLVPSGGVTLIDDGVVHKQGMLITSNIDQASILSIEPLSDDFTVSVTLRSTNDLTVVKNLVFEINNGNRDGFELHSYPNGEWHIFVQGIQSHMFLMNTADIHLAIVVTGGDNYTIYIDGIPLFIGTTTIPVAADFIKFYSGEFGTSFYDFMLFHRALTNTEVIQAGTISDETRFRLGAPFGTRTLIPEKSRYFVDRYYSDDDTPVLDALTEYFRGLVDDTEKVVLIPYSHRIVSIRAHIIIRDMINGSLVIPYDPDDNEILQLLTDYEYLKQYDVVFLEDSSLDLDYVDIQAMYTDQDISDTVLLQQINRVIEVLYNDAVNWLRPDNEG